MRHSAQQMKPDLARLGIFKEQSYITIGDPFREPPPWTTPFKSAFITTGSKNRSANGDGYFSSFSRVFHGGDDRPSQRVQSSSRRTRSPKPWRPASGIQRPSGSGSNYGTFTTYPIAYFNPRRRNTRSATSPKRGIYTSTQRSCGGAGIGPTPYPVHHPDPYDQVLAKEGSSVAIQGPFRLGARPTSGLFQENPYQCDNLMHKPWTPSTQLKSEQKTGRKPFRPPGAAGGCLSRYPEAVVTAAPAKLAAKKTVRRQQRPFTAAGALKSYPTLSIINKNVQKTITPANYNAVRKGIVYSWACE